MSLIIADLEVNAGLQDLKLWSRFEEALRC
jgi:hypothetical protein